MSKIVDSYKFTGKSIGKFIQTIIDRNPTEKNIPWARVHKKISECKVSLVTTAGISMKSDKPFDMETERKRKNWGDPSFRKIVRDATQKDLAVNHLHIDTSFIKRDINVAFPIETILSLEENKSIGSVADNHYSIMGFQGESSKTLKDQTSPEIAKDMLKDDVDLAILIPV